MRTSILAQVARAVCLTAIVVLALLTFPSAIPWMIAFWLSLHTFVALRGKPGWLPLLICLGVLLAKRVFWIPGLFVLVAMMLVTGLIHAMRSRKAWPSVRVAGVATLSLWAAWGLFYFDWKTGASCSHDVGLSGDRPVVCIGDSVTSGLLPEKGYPDVMADILSLPVINMGQSNKRGTKYLAEVVADTLVRMYGGEIRKAPGSD